MLDVTNFFALALSLTQNKHHLKHLIEVSRRNNSADNNSRIMKCYLRIINSWVIHLQLDQSNLIWILGNNCKISRIAKHNLSKQTEKMSSSKILHRS